MRDTDTGEYVGFAPLFDFNHAKDYTWTPDPTIDRLFSVVTEENRNVIRALTSRLKINTLDELYVNRADYILQHIKDDYL